MSRPVTNPKPNQVVEIYKPESITFKADKPEMIAALEFIYPCGKAGRDVGINDCESCGIDTNDCETYFANDGKATNSGKSITFEEYLKHKKMGKGVKMGVRIDCDECGSTIDGHDQAYCEDCYTAPTDLDCARPECTHYKKICSASDPIEHTGEFDEAGYPIFRCIKYLKRVENKWLDAAGKSQSA